MTHAEIVLVHIDAPHKAVLALHPSCLHRLCTRHVLHNILIEWVDAYDVKRITVSMTNMEFTICSGIVLMPGDTLPLKVARSQDKLKLETALNASAPYTRLIAVVSRDIACHAYMPALCL